MAPKADAPKKKVAKPAAKPAEDKKTAVAKKEEPKASEPKKAAAEAKEAEAEPSVEDAEMTEPIVEETPKEPEPPKEQEQDAPPIKGAKLEAGALSFYTEDTTLNVMPAANNKILMTLGEGGMQYLLAGVKANVGLKAGRYMFEALIAEAKNPVEPKADNQGPKPRNLVRVGVATAEASLLLADGAQSVCFDSEGNFIFGKEKKKVSQKFGVAQVVALVVNLDKSSPNANTVSLFVDGVRASEPQPLPDALKGKVLYPAMTFRNVTLQVSFGPSALKPLPFACHTVASAATADCQVKPKPAAKKQEIVFPVCLPDQGGFDWLDKFLAKNRSYTELSDRAIVDWITKSGIPRVTGKGKGSNDKPDMNYGIPLIDDYSINKAVWAVAPLLSRSYVVMEVKRNLMSEARKNILEFFPSSEFKRNALVVIGEPTTDYKSFVRSELLKRKEKKAEEEKKKKKLQKEKEAERQRLLEVKKKKAADAKKAKEAKEKAKAKAKAKAAVEKEEGEEAAAEEANEDAEKEAEENGNDATEEVKEPEAEEAKEPEPQEEEEEDVKVELTAEEENTWYLKKPVPDLKPSELEFFSSFCIPKMDEGFDEVKYEWYSEGKVADYLKDWMKEKKLTQKVDTLQPSEWFKKEFSKGRDQIAAWKRKQVDYPAKKKAALLAKKKAEAAKKKAAEDKKKAAEAAKKKKAEEKKDGEEENAEAAEEEDEEMAEEAVEEAAEEETVQIDPDDLDVFAVEDVDDIGNGEPLYLKFAHEDWALLSLGVELHILCHAFQRDLNDPERPAFPESHLSFYYNKYYKTTFSTKNYNCSSVAKAVELVKDMIAIKEPNATLEPEFPDDTPLDNFVKLIEEQRRQRQRRVDMGDESAELKFPRNVATAPAASAPAAGSGVPRITPRPSGGTTTRIGAYGPGAAQPATAGIKRPMGPAGMSAYPAAQRPRLGPSAGPYGSRPITPIRAYGAGALAAGAGPYGPPAGYGAYGGKGAYGPGAAGPGAYGAYYSPYR